MFLSIYECVRSNINFHPQNQEVDFGMLEMFFSFHCTKYDENRWLNTILFKNIARIANAVQVATLYSEDKIDQKILSTGR